MNCDNDTAELSVIIFVIVVETFFSSAICLACACRDLLQSTSRRRQCLHLANNMFLRLYPSQTGAEAMASACAVAAFPSATLSAALSWSMFGIAHAHAEALGCEGLGTVMPALAESTRAHSRRHCCVKVEKGACVWICNAEGKTTKHVHTTHFD